MRTLRIKKALPYMVTLSIFQFIISTAFYVVAAKFLVKPDLGLISTLTFVNTVFNTLAPLALPIAGTKYVSEFIGRNERKKAANVGRAVIRLVSILSISFLIGFTLISVVLVSALNWPQHSLTFLIITFIASSLGSLRLTHLGLLQGLQLFDRYAVSNILALIISRLAGLILIMLDFGITGFAIGLMCGEGFGLILSIFYYHNSLPKSSKFYDSRTLLKFSLPLLSMNVIAASSEWIDRALFILISQDLEALGVYELVIRGAGSLTVIWAIIDVIILPVFSETYGHRGKKELRDPLKKALRYLIFMYFPAALGLASISKTVMALLFGWEYTVGSTPLAILSVLSIFKAFTIIMGSTLKSIGETRVFAKASLASLIVDAVVVLFLTPYLSIYGAVAGRVCAVIVVFICIFYELKRNLAIELELESLLKGIAASLALAIPLQIFEQYVSGSHIKNPAFIVSIEILLGITLYILSLSLLRPLNRSDFKLLKRLTPEPLYRIVEFLEALLVH